MRSNSEIESLYPLVDEINSFYNQYHSLSNDELRATLLSIQQEIIASDNDVLAMDKNLSKVFAIVKETARRFSIGDVVVTASDKDRAFANAYDFVDLDGADAIYHNHWMALGVPVDWNMVHYDEQLMCGIMLHRGYAAEMSTGEGKTLAATLPVVLNALNHKGVHVQTTNEYLSKRDCETLRPIYSFLGLTVGCIEISRDSGNIYYVNKRKAYNADISFGSNNEFVFDYLFDHLALNKEQCVQKCHNFTIVDELVSILIDEANDPHIVCSLSNIDISEEINKCKPIIEEILANRKNYRVYKLRHNAVFTSVGKRWLIDKMGDMYSQRKSLLQQLLIAYTCYEKDVDYIVEKGKLVIIDDYTGRLKENNMWEYGLHQAVEAKEGLKISGLPDSSARITLKNYLKLYNKKAGMSGTLKPASVELYDVYGMKTVKIPTHKPCIRRDKPIMVFRTEEDKHEALFNIVKCLNRRGRPVLVGCMSTHEAECVAKMFEERNIKNHLLDAKTFADEAFIVSHAGEKGAITVSTSIAGRGTDIKLDNEALQCGGLAVLATGVSCSQRVDNQLRGRAGRQGNPGSSQILVSLSDDLLYALSAKERRQMKMDLKECAVGSRLPCRISRWFKLAQRNLEDETCRSRAKVALVDDAIAPYRKKYYDMRNRLLFDEAEAGMMMGGMLEEGVEKMCMDGNIHDLYRSVSVLLKNALRCNNYGLYPVPISYNRRVFNVYIDIETALGDESYFDYEIKKQTILAAYDSRWSEFVKQLEKHRLSSIEIKRLPHRLEEMEAEVKDYVHGCIRECTLPINIYVPSGVEVHHGQSDTRQPRKKTAAISPNDPCPCGSGKKYCECHGRNIRNTHSGRRF